MIRSFAGHQVRLKQPLGSRALQAASAISDRRSEAGFSLLETLVAIAVLGVASLPLLALQSQLARNSVQLVASASLLTVREVAQTYVSLLNDPSEGQGELDIGGGWKLTWTSEALTGPTDAVIGIGYRGRFQVQLFEVTAIIEHPSHPGFTLSRKLMRTLEIAPYRAG